MADVINKKDKKLQKRQNKLKGKEYYQEQQAKTAEELKGMNAEIDKDSHSSRIKSLSAAKKKEMLAEYEEVIKKLKELELRNKKKQDFKYSFKGLKYFSTLNSHSVYSESMQFQAKADKESISAMMAYGQLGAGFEITFEQMMQYIRPERKQEFISLCKNNSILSHNLMGMGKVLQFYNQRDFTRAYAAMVFFGLENNMELMETFLKVRFNADFKEQINDFKERIANASAFEEKEVRNEAGTNVFSQHDSQITEIKSSFYSKDLSEIFIETSNNNNEETLLNYKAPITKEAEIKLKAETYRNLIAKHHGNKMGVAVEEFLTRETKKAKRQLEITEKIEAEVENSLNAVFGDSLNKAERSEIKDILTTITTSRALAKEKSKSTICNNYFSNAKQFENLNQAKNNEIDPDKKEEIIAKLQELTDSVMLDGLYSIISGRLENSIKKNNQLLAEKADIIENLKNTSLSTKERAEYEVRLVEIANELESIKLPETIIKEVLADSGITQTDDYLKQFSIFMIEKNDTEKVDYSKPIVERNGFEVFIEENKFNKSALQLMLYKKKKELEKASTTPGNDDFVAKLLSQISKIEECLSVIERNRKSLATIQNNKDKKNILELLSGETSFALEHFSLILNLVDKAQFEKLIGRELSTGEFSLIKQKGFSDEFTIANEEVLIKLLTKKLANTYASQVKNNLIPNENIFEQMISDIEAKIAMLSSKITELKEQQKNTGSSEEKAVIGKKLGKLQTKIKLLQGAKDEVVKRQEAIEKEKQVKNQEKTKSPEEILENQLEYVIKRKLTTNMGDKTNQDIRFIDELTDEQIAERGMSKNSILNLVNVVFDSLERIMGLDLKSITQGDMSRVEDGLKRATALLERLKGKIPEPDFEILKAKSEWLLEKVYKLSNIVVKDSSEKTDESPENHTTDSQKEEVSTPESSSAENKSGSDALMEEINTSPKKPAGRTALDNNKERSS